MDAKKSRKTAEWLDSFAPKRVRRQLLALLAGQCLSYWGGKLLTLNRVHCCMALPLDEMIPVVPWTTLIYFGCFLFWAVGYAIILRTEPEGTHRFFRAELLGKLICFLFFVAIPTTSARPEISGSGIFAWFMRFLYAADTPRALFPSMHCFVSWMCVVGLRGKPQISKAYRATAVIAALLVFASTLTTKQHVLVDVPAGVALAELVYYVSGLFPEKKRLAAKKTDFDKRGT